MTLQRFIDAQEPVYGQVLSELRAGKKRSHWMWFVFPQIQGLGKSDTAWFYAIASQEEARQYIDHPLLGNRLVECARLVTQIEGKTATDILGTPDDVKLRSSMTLFATVSDADVFQDVLDKYFGGMPDAATVSILAED